MTDEQKRKYEEDIKGCGNLDYPLVGGVLCPICAICKNFDPHRGTWDPPECKVLGEIPLILRKCRSYSCHEFVHDKESNDNDCFDENLQPIRK